MTKILMAAAAVTLLSTGVHAQGKAVTEFNKFLVDKTLRIDYIFAGTASGQEIYLDEMSTYDRWAGRRVNLDRIPVAGNGCVSLRDSATSRIIYKQSFSTLFQEWQTTEEATLVRKSFENVFLVPMPAGTAYATVELFNTKGVRQAVLEHKVRPDDILVRKMTPVPAPNKYIVRSGDPKECIDIAIVAEGYTKKEAGKFYKDAKIATEAILEHEPFKKYKDRLNFIAVALPSEESGVSVPLEGKWCRTALSANFSTFYMDRYLTTLRLKNLADKLLGIPYEHIIILANTDTYGGGGIYNSYTLTTAHHDAFRPVVVHEFGHSFGALGDEYYYDDTYSPYYFPEVEPWEQNVSTLADFQSKWADMMTGEAKSKCCPGTSGFVPTKPVNAAEMWKAISEGADMKSFIGVYEGAGYMSKGCYRGFPDCRMKTNEAPVFCPICQRAIERMILFYTQEESD